MNEIPLLIAALIILSVLGEAFQPQIQAVWSPKIWAHTANVPAPAPALDFGVEQFTPPSPEVLLPLPQNQMTQDNTPEDKTKQEKITALRRAIIGQESGGKFNIVNPHSGALGYGQVMPANIPSWTAQALGKSISPQEFLMSPELQIKVIDHKLERYFDAALLKTGGAEAIAVRRVAAAWYSGKGSLHTSKRKQYYAGHAYPSISDYCDSVLQRYMSLLHGT